MNTFGPKPWVNPLEKNVNFSSFWTSSFDILERHFFVLEYRKRHFPGLNCLKKKVGKNVNFSTFWTSFSDSLERGFLVLEYRKRHFPGLNCLKKKLEKWPFLDQNHGLTPWEKCQFSTFWTSFSDGLGRGFSVLEYRKRHFPGLIWKNGSFWTKAMG